MYFTVIKHDGPGILEHRGKVENMSCRQVFSTFFGCSEMSGVCYQSVKQTRHTDRQTDAI